MPIQNVLICTGYTAFDHPDAVAYILVCNEALDLGHDHKCSLLCPNQMRMHGLEVNDVPSFLSRDPKSFHGIKVDEQLFLPYTFQTKMSILNTRTPTREELQRCEHIELTSDKPWEPQEDDWNEEQPRHALNTTTTNRGLDIDPETLKTRLGIISAEVLENTLQATTQLGTRYGMLPLHRRYKTRFQQLRHRCIKSVLYSDTFKSSTKSLRGNEYTQCFVTGEDLIFHFPMSREAHAPQGLVQWIAEYGIPAQIHTDNAKIETLGEWKRIANFHWIETTTTEPYSPWQNRAEREIKETKRHAKFIMDDANVPRKLWDYAVEYVCELRNHTARK
ncbi:MAG: hypothetical protein ACRDL7_04265 [Gaiellaceae bacterium]